MPKKHGIIQEIALCSALQVQALQFEWAWQHPLTSTIVRDVYKSVSKAKTMGLSGKVLHLSFERKIVENIY